MFCGRSAAKSANVTANVRSIMRPAWGERGQRKAPEREERNEARNETRMPANLKRNYLEVGVVPHHVGNALLTIAVKHRASSLNSYGPISCGPILMGFAAVCVASCEHWRGECR